MAVSTRRFLLALTALAALGMGLAARSMAAEPGVNSDVTWGLSSSDVDRSVSMMKADGVRWARIAVSWKSVEPNSKGSYNSGYLSNIDSIVSKLNAAGIKIEMLFDTVPYWASADPNKHLDSSGNKVWNGYYRPTSFQDYADAAAYVAKRYYAQGVNVFEVWNEPNYSIFWPSGVNANEYARMLNAAYPAIKGVAPDSTVIGGTLSENDYRYLSSLYAAGAGNSFDAVSTHDYPNKGPNDCWTDSSGHLDRDAFCSIEEIRRTMVDNGDSAKPVWLDEFGWSTCDNSYSSCWGKGVTENQQANYVSAAYAKLESYPWVKAALVYAYRNTYWLHDSPSNWNANLGMLHSDFSPKAAEQAFADYALGTGGSTPTDPPPPDQPPADQPPAVTLDAPTTGSAFDRRLSVAATATDDNAVTKVEFWVDDRLVSTDTTAPYGYDWKAPKRLAYGTHTVKARAFDGAGQAASDSVTATRSQSVTLSVAGAGKVGSARMRASGRVLAARSGHVSIRLQRRSHRAGRWVRVTKKRAAISSTGAYSERLARLRHSGRWRARAVYRTSQRSARSGYRYFRVS